MTFEEQLQRVRDICFKLPETSERLSHGEPTFFVRKRVFVMFDNDHHGSGHIAVWVPAAFGLQEMLIESEPDTFFKPPYVGHKGWIGIRLDHINDEDLEFHIVDGWGLVAPKKLKAHVESGSWASEENEEGRPTL